MRGSHGVSQLSLPLVPPPAARLSPPTARRPHPQVLLGGVRDRLRYFGINGISNVEQNGGAEHEYSRRGCVDLTGGVVEGVEAGKRHGAHGSRGHIPEASPRCCVTHQVTLVKLQPALPMTSFGMTYVMEFQVTGCWNVASLSV